MTLETIAEVSSTSGVAGLTVATALVEADVSGVLSVLVPVGAAAVVGYFSAQMTVRSELSELRTELRLIRQELHRYYPTRGEMSHQRHMEEEG